MIIFDLKSVLSIIILIISYVWFLFAWNLFQCFQSQPIYVTLNSKGVSNLYPIGNYSVILIVQINVFHFDISIHVYKKCCQNKIFAYSLCLSSCIFNLFVKFYFLLVQSTGHINYIPHGELVNVYNTSQFFCTLLSLSPLHFLILFPYFLKSQIFTIVLCHTLYHTLIIYHTY